MRTVGLLLLLLIASHLLVLAAALLIGAGALVGSAAAGGLAAALLLLPPLLAAAALPQRQLALPATMIAWSLAALIGAPALLPYPAPSAVDAGFGLVGAGCQGIGAVPYAIIPDLSGQQPVATVAAAIDCPPPATTTPPPTATTTPTTSAVDVLAVGPSDVVLSYERSGNSIIVPVRFEGPRGVVELPMIFDTGATLTTLGSEDLARLGLVIAPDAPVITSQTAGGIRTSQATRTPGLSIGGHRVETVTISECEDCVTEDARGLLGMNTSGRFLITIDTAEQRLILRPREGGMTRDVEPWVDLSASALQDASGAITVTLTAKNLADQPVSRARVQVNCSEEALGEISDIPASGEKSVKIELPAGTRCDDYTIELDHAVW